MNLSTNSQPHRNGFTIVELLLVVVVIAILAAITIVAYNGISQRATESSMQSDLQNAGTTLENDKTTSGSYPLNAASANGGRGLKVSGENIQAYTLKPYGYCVSTSNPRTSKTFVLKSVVGQIKDGDCIVNTSTIAGSATQKWMYVDGPAADARFDWMEDVKVDSSGNIFIADQGNGRIRKLSPDGVVSTFATSNAYRLAIDSDGNVYTGGAHCIEKISPSGTVSVLAGVCATSGYADGTGSAARFNSPRGMAIDASGNLYVGDSSNHRIRKVTQAGVVTTIAGSGVQGYTNGTGTSAQFTYPNDIILKSDGTLYVAGTNCIRQISPSGVVSTYLGVCGALGYVDGSGTAVRFGYLQYMVMGPAGELYVNDQSFGNNYIRTISPTGEVSTILGGVYGYVDGNSSTALLDDAGGLSVASDGTLYYGDADNCVVRKIVQ